MKKILGLFAGFSMLMSGGVQAVQIDSVATYSSADTFIAQSNAAVTTTQLNGVLRVTTSADLQTLSTGDSDGTAFEHDYFFLAVTDTFFAVTTTIENTLTGTIASFIVDVFENSFANLIATDTVLPTGPNQSSSTLGFNMVAGNSYAIRLRGDVGNSVDPDYTMQTSVIPVPAAVWLFGTAMLGLFGIRRKNKMQAAA